MLYSKHHIGCSKLLNSHLTRETALCSLLQSTNVFHNNKVENVFVKLAALGFGCTICFRYIIFSSCVMRNKKLKIEKRHTFLRHYTSNPAASYLVEVTP